MELNKIYQHNVLATPWPLEDNSIDCCVTSPPYWGLRDYGVEGQLGLEAMPEEFIQNMVTVFEEVKRVLKPTGTLWINIGDSYAHNGAAYGNDKSTLIGRKQGKEMGQAKRFVKKGSDLKPKDLVSIPWMLAFALRYAGWYLRQDIIWHKPNPMPESCKDRCTKSHEYIFLLSKSEKYYYDQKSIKTKATSVTTKQPDGWDTGPGSHGRFHREGREKGKKAPKTINQIEAANYGINGKGFIGHSGNYDHDGKLIGNGMANKRSVWTVPTAPFSEAHFATFPEELITPCILAGCQKEGIVLDPFMGAGTTALVAMSHGRKFIGFELNPEYIKIANKRLKQKFGMFYEAT